jgi:hypothetical protein
MKSEQKYRFGRAGVIALSLVIALAVTACGVDTEQGVETEDLKLELTYVSGHLGNDWDCGVAGDSDPAKPGMAMERCDPEFEDQCGGPLNCENGEITLQLRNVGQTAIVGLEVSDLELLKVELTYLTGLEISSVSRPDGHDFDGTIEPEGVIQLRVTFPSPGDQGSVEQARVHVIVLDKKGRTTEITTPELQTLPVVAT